MRSPRCDLRHYELHLYLKGCTLLHKSIANVFIDLQNWALDDMLLSSLADFWRLSLGSVAMGIVYLLLAYLFTREDLLYVWRLILHHVLRRPAHQS